MDIPSSDSPKLYASVKFLKRCHLSLAETFLQLRVAIIYL